MNSYTLDYINQTHFRQKKNRTHNAANYLRNIIPLIECYFSVKILLQKHPIEIDYSSTLYHKRGA
jgi:hypothetical protein